MNWQYHRVQNLQIPPKRQLPERLVQHRFSAHPTVCDRNPGPKKVTSDAPPKYFKPSAEKMFQTFFEDITAPSDSRASP